MPGWAGGGADLTLAVRMMGDFSMSTDSLLEILAEKQRRFDANVRALEEAYVEHEDFIFAFDSLIDQLTDHENVSGTTLAATRALRDRAYELLLGPVGPERDAAVDLRTGESV